MIEHPVYGDSVVHTFKEQTLRDIKKHSDEVMVDTHNTTVSSNTVLKTTG